MSSSTKTILLVLGFLSAILIVTQLVMGLLILNGAAASIRTAHQHSGYLTVTVSLVYIIVSLFKVLGIPSTNTTK
ncbi:MAG: hypothetical protein SFX72_11115 [Isosphaeraceae bacterium]|nr:hypothetical protein [Isosphaeraceae bacterium]